MPRDAQTCASTYAKLLVRPPLAPPWEISQCPFPVSHAACVCSTFGMRFVTKCLSRCGLVAQNTHPNVPQYLTACIPWQPGALACCIGHHSAPHRTLPCPAMPCHSVRSLPIPSHGSDQREQPQSSSDYAAEALASICYVCLWDLPDGAWLWGLPTHSAVAVGRIRFHHRGRIQIRPINSLHCSIECAIPVPRIPHPNSGIRPGQLGQPRASRRPPRPSTLARQAGHSILDAGQLASLRHSTPPQTHARVER